MRYGVIMAGGTGTRLWPMSRAARPKQLLPLIEGDGGETRSLLRLAADRLDGVVDSEHRYVCTGEGYRDAIRESIPEFSDAQILGEPMGRDTVNAIGLAAAVFQKQDPDAVFVVLTADHIIRPQRVFSETADLAFRLVEDDPSRLMTFSIKPTHPATGYGYVERGRELAAVDGDRGLAFRVTRFVEKPPLHKAQAYFESGVFSWNSGMFVFHAGTFLTCLQHYQPENWQGLMKIAEAWGTDSQSAVLNEVYPTLKKISVDYAVMEPASDDSRVTIGTVLCEVDWLDVGSWPSYGETLTPDAAGNRAGGSVANSVVAVDSRDNLVVSDVPGHSVSLLGCDDLIVVHTKDATLVMPRERAEDLKQLHAQVPDGLK